MASAFQAPETSPGWQGRIRRLAIATIRFVLTGLLLGWLYAWAAPIAYPQGSSPGFWLGSAHGALMPMALPSLLMGKDVPIYAENNSGRSYKIGYIAGINACGFVVFGLAFWYPKRPA